MERPLTTTETLNQLSSVILDAALTVVHEAQIISYLKPANKRPGFLIHSNVPLLKNGFRRFVNKL